MGRHTRKRILFGITVLTLCGLIAGCGNSKAVATMQIQASVLTESESNVMKLIQPIGRSSQVFDFSADSNLKSASIAGYKLGDNGKWVVISGPSSFALQETSGRIAISFGNMVEGLRVAIQQEDGLTASESQPGQKSDPSDMGTSTSFASLEKIEYGKEIPLAIQVYSSGGDFTSSEVDAFYHPEKLLKSGYDKVFVVVIQFSKDGLK